MATIEIHIGGSDSSMPGDGRTSTLSSFPVRSPSSAVIPQPVPGGISIPEPELSSFPEGGVLARLEAGIRAFADGIEREPHSPHELAVEPYHLKVSYLPADGAAGEATHPHVDLRLDLEPDSPLWNSPRMGYILVETSHRVRESLALLSPEIRLTPKNIKPNYGRKAATYLEEHVYQEWMSLERFWGVIEEFLKIDLDTPQKTIVAHREALLRLQQKARQMATFVKFGLGVTQGISSDHASDWHGVFSLFHDCNNSLTPVMGLVELALMDIERAKKRNYNFLKIPNTVGRLVETICSRQSSYFEELHPHLITNFPIELNQLSLLDVDERFVFRRVATNLVVNAIKNGKPGVPPVVRVRSGFVNYQAKPHLAFVVEDEGTGMSADFMREKLGRPGKRAGVYQGDGQGVSGSLRLLHSLGGHMRVASVKGEGSAFALVVPVDRLQLGVAKEADKMGLIGQSSLDLKGMSHLSLFKDEPNCFQRGNLFVVGEKHWGLEMRANFISDAPFEILYFALPQKVRDFVPEEAHVLLSVGAIRALQFLPFMPKTSVGSLKGMASLVVPMAMASIGWNWVGQASGLETLEQEQLANNLLMSVTGTAIQYGAHRLGMAKALPYLGYALGADILVGGVFSLGALALEQAGVGSLASYRMDHLVWDRMVQKKVGQVPFIGGALAMLAGTFSNTSYALGYLSAAGEQIVTPYRAGGLFDEVDQLKKEMVDQAEAQAQTILDKTGNNPDSIQQALWDHRHDATMDTRSLYIVANAARYSNQKSSLSLLTTAFDRKAHWSTGTRRIQIVDEGALKELTKS